MGVSIANKIAGCVLGAAIGDAMGKPTEFLSIGSIKRKYPPNGVQGFEEWWERDGNRFAPYTDDTQMAEVVLRALLRRRKTNSDLDAVMEDIAAGFVEWAANPPGGHRAPGNACLTGTAQLAKGVRWDVAGGEAAGGCGSVMRAYPFGVVFADDPDKAQEWAVQHSKLTHRDPIALAACAAMAEGVALTLRGEGLDSVLNAMVAASGRHSPPTAEMMLEAIDDARTGEEPDVVLCRLQGWVAHQAIAAAVFVVARHPDDPRAAILQGANSDGDSDSIATLAGALVGARVGLSAIPPEWIRDVERSDEFLALAREIASEVDP